MNQEGLFLKHLLSIFFKISLCFLLVFLPLKISGVHWNSDSLKTIISKWLINPRIDIETEDFTYLITLIPNQDKIISIQDGIEVSAPLIPRFESRKTEKKRIFLYNTHQSETYSDGVTIYEVTVHFAKMLEDAGFDVIFESSNFLEEAMKEGIDYSQLYAISRKYINEAFVNYGGFDLVIDVHRDSCDRSVSLYQSEDMNYARLMFVVGMKSENANEIMELSMTVTDKMQQRENGIMRAPFKRQSVYNQDMFNKMLLLEVGADQNTSTEALNSLRLLTKVLKEEWF